MNRVLLDQGLPATAASNLRDRDWDAVHVREIDTHMAADDEILEYAANDSRVVVTLDRDIPRAALGQGCVLKVGAKGTRIRLLPLR